MHLVSQDEPAIKAEGRLLGRSWKLGVASSHPSTLDGVENQWSVPPTLHLSLQCPCQSHCCNGANV